MTLQTSCSNIPYLFWISLTWLHWFAGLVNKSIAWVWERKKIWFRPLHIDFVFRGLLLSPAILNRPFRLFNISFVFRIMAWSLARPGEKERGLLPLQLPQGQAICNICYQQPCVRPLGFKDTNNNAYASSSPLDSPWAWTQFMEDTQWHAVTVLPLPSLLYSIFCDIKM